MDAIKGVLGAESGLVGVFDQRDVGLFLRVLNATELLSHREKVSRHLTWVHQQHSPEERRHMVSLVMCEHVRGCKQDAMVVVVVVVSRKGDERGLSQSTC